MMNVEGELILRAIMTATANVPRDKMMKSYQSSKRFASVSLLSYFP